MKKKPDRYAESPEVQTLSMEKRQSADMKQLDKKDAYRPSLRFALWFDLARWGLALLAVVAVILITRPIWQPVVDFVYWGIESLFG